MKRLLTILLIALLLGGTDTIVTNAMVNEVTARDEYVGNGSTTAFTYSFRILTTADIQVLSDGVVQTLTTDYTVSGAGDSGGGTVTYVTAPASAVAVTLIRLQKIEQQTDYITNQTFASRAEIIEKDLDKAIMGLQQQDERLNRALSLTVQSTKTAITMPDPVAGQFLKWNTALSGLDNTVLSSLIAGAISSGLDNQIAVYDAAGTSLEGDANFTWDGTSLTVQNTGVDSDAIIDLKNDVQTWRLSVQGGSSDRFSIRDITANTNPFVIQAGAPNETLTLSSSGIVLMGNTVTTGAGAGDIVTANTGTYRFLDSAGTTSAQFGIQGNASDEMDFRVPAVTDQYNFRYAGTTEFIIDMANSGAGLHILSESSSDHTAPAANGAIIYTRDNATKTELVVRFASGAVQVIATEP